MLSSDLRSFCPVFIQQTRGIAQSGEKSGGIPGQCQPLLWRAELPISSLGRIELPYFSFLKGALDVAVQKLCTLSSAESPVDCIEDMEAVHWVVLISPQLRGRCWTRWQLASRWYRSVYLNI